ncbi:MAG: two-component system sensor histidine kinase NtrB [Planctomycetota bacterium]|jgi:two-component system sensor histidine kinase PilS (NtrC family)
MDPYAKWMPVCALFAAAAGESGRLEPHLHTSAVLGIGVAVLVAVFLGWMIIQASPPLLPPVGKPGDRPALSRPTARAANFCAWFVVTRWIAVICAGTLVFIAVKLAHLLPEDVWWPLVLTVALLAALNTGYVVLTRRGWAPERLLLIQVYADLALLTLLLHFSGGIENPLSLLMLLHVIIGGIVLRRRQCYGVAAAATVLIGAMAAVEGFGITHHYTLGIFPHEGDGHDGVHAALDPLFALSSVTLQGVFFFLTAYFVSQLAARLRHDERQLESMAEHAVSERQLLERALDTTGTALRVLDRDVGPEFTNRRWSDWFAPEGDAVALLPQIDGEGSSSELTRADGKVRVSELRDSERKSGRTFQITTARLPGTDSGPGQVVELVQDISAQKDVQAQILKAGRLAAVGELAGHVAHEVNNPIAIISGKARLLLSRHRADLTPILTEELEKIVDLSDRVARIAQRLLSSGRPAPGVRELIGLRTPLRKVLEMVDHRARGSGVEVTETIPSSLPPVSANAHEMEQVFLNLVLNALDAMAKGGTLSVEAATAPSVNDGADLVVIGIRDTGPGIDEEIRSAIFDPFFSTKSEERGTGLGLPICRRIVESHGGVLELTESSGAGSRFEVRIPVAESNEPSHG